MNAHGPGRDNADEPAKPHSTAGTWRKSSFSMSNGDCVEIAVVGGNHVGVRDSRASAGPCLRFHPDTWTAFIQNVKGLQSFVCRA